MDTTHMILIVEDDPEYRDNMKLILSMEGFSVHTAADAPSGIVLLGKTVPDLILCDIMMPDMDGHAFLDRLKQDPRYAATSFIFVTALSERADIRGGMAAGADDYLTKPFTAEELIAAVKGRLYRHGAIRQGTGDDTLRQEMDILRTAITAREREVLVLVGCGATSKQIADHLGISIRTVENHRANIMGKLDASNAASLGHWAAVARQMDPAAPVPSPAPPGPD